MLIIINLRLLFRRRPIPRSVHFYGMHFAKQSSMNLVDFIFLYFAFGAPFGVLYYFENSNQKPVNYLSLRSFLTSIIWLPFAIKIFRSKIFKQRRGAKPDSDHLCSLQKLKPPIFRFQAELEELYLRSKSNVSIYEFRETIERYIGLTVANQKVECITGSADDGNAHLNNLVGGNSEVFQACLLRRNHKLLSYHLNLARREFFDILGEMRNLVADRENLRQLSSEFVVVLNDFEAHKLISSTFAGSPQIENDLLVNVSENEIWTTDKIKRSRENQVLTN